MDAYLFPLLATVVLAEAVLSGRWKKIYFTFGLPLFSRNISSYAIDIVSSDIVKELNDKFKSNGYASSLHFKEIDSKTIAFREKFFELCLFSYTPVMHGRISLVTNNPEIEVAGLSNWFPIVFIVFWYSALLSNISFERDFIFLVAPALLFGVIYFIQRKKYARVCAFLAEIGRQGQV